MNFLLRRFGLTFLLLVLLFPLLVSVSNASFAASKRIQTTTELRNDEMEEGQGNNLPQPPFIPLGEFGYGPEYNYEHGFAAFGNYIYFIEQSRVRVLSYAEPGRAQVVSDIFHPERSRRFQHVELSPDGSRLIVISESSVYIPYPPYHKDLLLYDVSNPAAPRLLDRVLLSHPMHSVESIGNNLYIGTNGDDNEPTLLIYGWGNDELTLRGETVLEAGIYDVEMYLDGNTLILAPWDDSNRSSTIWLYDVTDVTAPTYIGAIPSIGGVAMPANGYLYVRNGDRGRAYLDIWDISNPTSPFVVQSYSNFTDYPLEVRGTRMIWSRPLSSELRLYDISNPLLPQVLGFSPHNFNQLVWSEENVFYSFQSQQYNTPTLEKLTFTDTFSLTLQGNYPLSIYSNGVAVDERYLYLFNYHRDIAGIEIMDMAEPTQPRLVGTVLEGEFIEAPIPEYLIADQRLYLRREGDIMVFDISNPTNPILMATIPFDGNWEFETIANGHLYANAPYSNLMYILRLSDYGGKVIATPGTDNCSGFDSEGNYLVALCGEVIIYDISTPMEPTVVGLLESPLEFYEPELAFPYLYTTSQTQLAIYDVSNPAQPSYMTSISNPNNLDGCETLIPLQEHYYLRACGSRRDVDIVNLSDPKNPLRSDIGYLGPNVTVQGSFISVISGEFQTWQIRLPMAHQIALPTIYTR